MPRKVQPSRQLIIEGISTGALSRSVPQVDDFTGQPVPIDPRIVPKAPMDIPQQMQARKAKAEATRHAPALAALAGAVDPKLVQARKPFKRRI